MRRSKFRVPRWLIVVAVAGFCLVSLLVVGAGIVLFRVGGEVVALVRDAPGYIALKAEEAKADPAVAAVLDRKLSCVDLVGGPSADGLYQAAVDHAPTAQLRERVESLGRQIGLPRDSQMRPGEVFAHCVFGEKPTG